MEAYLVPSKGGGTMTHHEKTLKRKEKELLKQDAFLMFHEKGISLADIAKQLDVSTRTIRRWIQEAATSMEHPSDTIIRHKKRPRQYAQAIFDRITAIKKENEHRPATTVHRILHGELGKKCPSVSLIRKFIADAGLKPGKNENRKGYVKFTRPRPNDLWQIDIAGVRTVGHLGKVFLHAILDDCSRYIVAARYYSDQRGINVLRILRDAFEEYGRPNQVLADNGTQFRNLLGELGTKYTRFLELVDVEPIFARPYHPQTKGKLERWFGTVAGNFLSEARLRADNESMVIGDLNRLLGEWVTWYNNVKPHRSFPAGTTPASVYFGIKDRVHRPLATSIDWERWFLVAGTRKVTKYSTISYKRETIPIPPGHAGCKVDILDAGDRFEIYHGDDRLASHVVDMDFMKIRNKEFERKVNKDGYVKYRGCMFPLGSLMAGKQIIIKEMDQGRKIAVYCDNVLFKEFD
nr:DDE-type integrase/transposase/recombinase [Candidatus Sigynarchaeota archaeon]